jgi:hypothetical protein
MPGSAVQIGGEDGDRTMTGKRYEELAPAARRRLVTVALLRAAGSAALLVVGYYLAPLDRPLDAGTWIAFFLGLVVFAAVIAWQVRAIAGSDVPRLRAIQGVALGLPLLLLVFASTYVLVSSARPDSFTEPLGHTDSLYFTVTVFSTVGFGDIVPLTEVARIVTTIQMLMGLVTVGVVAKVLLGAVQVAQRRQDGSERGPAGTEGSPRTRDDDRSADS